MGRKIVIIGGVACGPKAAARARRRDPEAKITIIERREVVSFASCGLPYYVGGVVPGIEGLVTTSFGNKRDTEYFQRVKNVRVMTNTEARAIDRENKKVKVADLGSGERTELPYDKLVYAAGARPKRPPLPGSDADNVWNLWTPADAALIRESIEAGEADRICIIGAGLIGLEAAEALVNQAVDVTMIEMMPQVLYPSHDPEMAGLVERALRGENVVLRLGERVSALLTEDNRVVKVETDKGEVETDGVIMAAGAEPEVELARECGLEVGTTGALSVDSRLCTSDPDIFAGGDCVENTHLVTGEKAWTPLGSTANIHGRIIGDNLTGGDSGFPGVVGTGIMRTLGIDAACAGLSETSARQMGYDTVSALAPFNDKSHYYPGGKNVTIKLVAEKSTGRLLGVQVVGPGDVARIIDACAAALRLGAKVEDLGKLDFAYAPPFGTPIEPLSQTANLLQNKVEGLAEPVPPLSMKELLASDRDMVILDVRTGPELESMPPIQDPRTRTVDMSELRARVPELPGDKPVIVVCQFGQRAYDVQCMLKGAGFKQARFLEGGMNVFTRLGDERT